MVSEASQQAMRASNGADRPAGPGRSGVWIRSLALILAVLVSLLAIGWVSFPAWAPKLAERFAPQPWQVLALDLKRPGLSKLHVNRLVARGTFGGMLLELEISDAELAYSGPQIAIPDVTLTLLKAPSRPEPKAFSPDDLALPRIILPGSVPGVNITRLSVVDKRHSEIQRWHFNDLIFDGQGEGLSLVTDIAGDLPIDESIALALTLKANALDVRLLNSRDSSRELLRLTQDPDPADPLGAIARLSWQLDLARIDWLPLQQSLNLETGSGNWKQVDAASGEFSGHIGFSGRERLMPTSGLLSLTKMAIETPAGTLAGEFTTNISLDETHLTMTAQDLALTLDALEIDDLTEMGIDPHRYGLSGATGEAPVKLVLNAASPVLSPVSLSLPLDLIVPAPDQATQATTAEDNVVPLPAQSLPALHVKGDLAVSWAQTDGLDIGLDLQTAGSTFEIGEGFRVIELAADIQSDMTLHRPLAWSDQLQTLGASSGTGLLKMSVRGQDNALSLRGELTTLRLSDASFSAPGSTARIGSLAIDGAFELETGNDNSGSKYSAASGRAIKFTGPISGENLIFASEDNPLTPPLVSAQALSTDISVSSITSLNPAAPATGEGTMVNGLIALAGVRLPTANVTANSVTLDLNPLRLEDFTGELGLLTTGLTASLDGVKRSGFDLDLNGTLSEASVYAGQGELLIGYQAALPFGFTADLNSLTGRISLRNAVLPASGLGALATPMALTLPETFRVTDGALVLNGNLDAGAGGLTGTLDIRGEDLGLGLGESSIEALNFSTRLNLDQVLSGNGSLVVAVARLAAGLDMTSLSTELEISDADSFGLSGLNASLLEGQLSAPSLRLSDGRLQDGNIRWEGFNLASLLGFMDVAGLDGTGTLDAEFPLVAEPSGLAVRAGTFSARAPGRLRYSSGVPATNIGLQALENFEYDALSGTVDYGSDGAYTLGIDLLGRNPDLYGGHPIRFRLNLGGVMPALFSSLFVTGDFDKAIIERLRTGEPALEPGAGVD